MVGEKHNVATTLNYWDDPGDGSKPTPIFIGEGRISNKRPHKAHEFVISDISGEEGQYTLDQHGFQYLHHASIEKTFADEERIKVAYYEECRQLLTSATGARMVHIFNHKVRRGPTQWHHLGLRNLANRGPVTRTHVDQSYDGAERRLRWEFPSREEADELVMPTATERLIWAQGGTATLKAVSTVIRGTRVNKAAAICWENYMPMLRQALYAQNVNLYLAPTADARDAWLSLMRSVGCEGRCFVVSSNMAVREKPSSGASGNGVQQQQQQQQQQGNGVRGRQGSCITEEGHEIVLPGDKSASTSPTGARKARRKSVMVEDGHEVVLGCDDDNGTSMPEGLKPSVDWTNGTKRADDAASGWSCRGGSSIVGPFGDVLAGPQWEDDENIIYADVNFEDCVGGRLDLDAGSSYSRNDSFKFSVEGLDLEPLPYY
ncbi:Nitrilase like protein [Verticillium longisporum]|nr:Nitrilase like protein [Verticillium longisporum]